MVCPMSEKQGVGSSILPLATYENIDKFIIKFNRPKSYKK